ncbi:MAG: methionine ABC transporter permease [Oligoflexales bacterium]
MSLDLLFKACLESIYMVLVSGIGSCVFGIPLGIALFVSNKNQIMASKLRYHMLNTLVNSARSVPFIILLVAIIPFTRFIVGSSIGTHAAMVPLTIAAIPFMARLVDGVLAELPSGLIEAMQSMGASPMQIVTKGLIPEAFPGIVNAITVTLVNLIGYSAMAGTVGGGGLGDLAIRYGYQRFDGKVMLITVLILVFMVQGVQSCGDLLAKHLRRV